MELKNVVPKIRLKITKPDGTIRSIVSRKKMRVISFIKRETISECELAVIYEKSIGNSGTFSTQKSVLQALTDWTSWDQIDFVEDGEWE